MNISFSFFMSIISSSFHTNYINILIFFKFNRHVYAQRCSHQTLPPGDKTPTNEEQEERYLRRLSGSSGSPVSLHTAVSAASSRGTLVSQGGHVYRNARPYRKSAHPSQGMWEILQFTPYVCGVKIALECSYIRL